MHGTGARHGRRRFLRGLALGMAAFTTRGVFAQQLAPTASTGEGPFYPNKLPLDADNDLLIVNDAITPAAGVITTSDRPRLDSHRPASPERLRGDR